MYGTTRSNVPYKHTAISIKRFTSRPTELLLRTNKLGSPQQNNFASTGNSESILRDLLHAQIDFETLPASTFYLTQVNIRYLTVHTALHNPIFKHQCSESVSF